MTTESREYEEIAAALKRALDPRQEVRIITHARVTDAVTGRPRDIDVLLETVVAGTTVRLAIECRRRKRAIDKPQIEAFVTKLEDCKIEKGVFVSSSGFAQEALAAAAHHNIVCCHLTEVAQLPWLEILSIRLQHQTNIKFHGDVQFTLAGPLAGAPSCFEFPGGTPPPIPFSEIGRYILSLQNVQPGHHRRQIIYEPVTRPLAVVPGHPPVPIVRVKLDAEFDVVEIEPRVEHWLYARDGEAPSAGITRMTFGNIEGLPLSVEITATATPEAPPQPPTDRKRHRKKKN